MLTVCSTVVFGSCLAHSKISTLFFPSRTRRHSSTLRRMFSSEPSGTRAPRFRPPLMLRTTLSAFSGYLVKYLLRRCSELLSGVPYSSPPFQKLAPSFNAVFKVSKATSSLGGVGFQVNPAIAMVILSVLFDLSFLLFSFFLFFADSQDCAFALESGRQRKHTHHSIARRANLSSDEDRHVDRGDSYL